MNATTVTIVYEVGVKVPAGWRTVSVQAIAEKTSEKMAVVKKVVMMDHEVPHYGQSRTGAKRQEFNGNYWAAQEVGKKKRLSACRVIQSKE